MGKGIKEFNVYKFRTMKANREELKSNLTHEQMVTKIGKFLRKTSLDELPQLFNIIKGEMSFIGPRPWIPEYYEFFTEEQMKRASVKPGISGLAQVKGRNGINIFEKINYDLEYIDNMGLKQDIKIVFETIKTVISKDDAEISEQGIKEEIFEKINYDLEYIDNMGLKQDIKIVFETIKTVISKDDAEISEQGIKEEIQELKINNIEIQQNATKLREVV